MELSSQSWDGMGEGGEARGVARTGQISKLCPGRQISLMAEFLIKFYWHTATPIPSLSSVAIFTLQWEVSSVTETVRLAKPKILTAGPSQRNFSVSSLRLLFA